MHAFLQAYAAHGLQHPLKVNVRAYGEYPGNADGCAGWVSVCAGGCVGCCHSHQPRVRAGGAHRVHVRARVPATRAGARGRGFQ